MLLRVIDYKTGRKAFDLSEIVHGRNMQMLIYLFALQESGSMMYGKRVTPAGVLYVPARDVVLKTSRNATDEEIKKMREKELRRKGLVLSDAAVIDLMENGEEKRYLPVKTAKDGIKGDSLVSSEQIGMLADHVKHMLRRAADEIRSGRIDCNPYFASANDNACQYCEYGSVCAFDEDSGDRRKFVSKLKTSEVWDVLGDRS